MSKSAQNILENTLLLLMTGSPLASVRSAMEDLSKCVASSYDEDVVACVDGPARSVAASWLVLTDYRTWLWPPDEDLADDVHLDVLIRRLKPDVRRDQCSKSDKPH